VFPFSNSQTHFIQLNWNPSFFRAVRIGGRCCYDNFFIAWALWFSCGYCDKCPDSTDVELGDNALERRDNALSFNRREVTAPIAGERFVLWLESAKSCMGELGVIASPFSLAQLAVLLESDALVVDSEDELCTFIECWESNRTNS
jgi:hypothetical protein